MQLALYQYDDGSHQFSDVRTIEINGVLWFVGSDVARILGYSNTNDAIDRHCKPQGIAFHDTPTSSGTQRLKFINEPNVYRLIVRARLRNFNLE